MRISIIIPTFRPDDYLLDCLQSIENQTLSKNEYEVIIVLNGDKEPYYSKIQTWIKNLTCHIRIIYTEKIGVSNARNIALDNSSCSFIAFIDDDDFISPNYLSSLLFCIEENPISSIACSDVRTYNSNNETGLDYISKAYIKAILCPKKKSIFARRSFLSSSCCKLIPKNIIGNRRFLTNLKIGEDVAFMAIISDSISNIVIADKSAIYYRRIRQGSALRNNKKINKQKQVKLKVHILKYYLKQYVKNILHYNFPFFMTRILSVITSKNLQ